MTRFLFAPLLFMLLTTSGGVCGDLLGELGGLGEKGGKGDKSSPLSALTGSSDIPSSGVATAAPGAPAAIPGAPPIPGKDAIGKMEGKLGGSGLLKAFGEEKVGKAGALLSKAASVVGRYGKTNMKELMEKKSVQIKKEPSPPLTLKTAKKGDIFYLPLDKLRPGILTFPQKKLERRLSHLYGGVPQIKDTLPFDEGKAFRDRNRPFKVVIGPDHQFCVFDDEYYELYQDILSGAKTIPVLINEDYSGIANEDVFWERMQNETRVYLLDMDGNFQKAPESFDAIDDSPIISNLDVIVPEILNFKDLPLQRIYTYVDTPAGIRVQKGATQFLSYELARQFKKEIEEDDVGERQEDPEVMDGLRALFTDDDKIPDARIIEKARNLLWEVNKALDKNRWKGFYALRVPENFNTINLQYITELSGQIMIIKVKPEP